MKYIRNAQGQVNGWDETVPEQEALIAAALSDGSTDITGSWPPAPTAAQIAAQELAAFIFSVRSTLTETDNTMERIQEAVSLGFTTWSTADVVAFVSYRRALRALLHSTTVGVLPTKPVFPQGT